MDSRSWSEVVGSPLTSVQKALRKIFIDGKGFVGHVVDSSGIDTHADMAAEVDTERFIDKHLDAAIMKLIYEQVQVQNTRCIAEDKEMMKMHVSIARSALSYKDLSKKLNEMYHNPESFITPEVELAFVNQIWFMVCGLQKVKYTIAKKDLTNCLTYHLLHMRLIRGDSRFLVYKPKKDFYSDMLPYQSVMEVLISDVAECTIPKEDVDALENGTNSPEQTREALSYTFAIVKSKYTYEKDALLPAVREMLSKHTKMEVVKCVARDKEIVDAQVSLCTFPMTPKAFGEIITAMCCDPLSFVSDEMMFRYLNIVHSNIEKMHPKDIDDARYDFATCLLYNIAHMRFVKQEQMFFWYKPLAYFAPYEFFRKDMGKYSINMTMQGVDLPAISEYDPAKAAAFADEVLSDLGTQIQTRQISAEHGDIEHVKPVITAVLKKYKEGESPVPTLEVRRDEVLHFLTGIKPVEVEQSLDIPQKALAFTQHA